MKRLINVICIAALVYLMFGGATAPFKTDRLSVLIVEETEDRGSLPSSQVAAIDSTIWRAYVMEHDGQHRRLDDDADISAENQWVKDAFALPRASLPHLVVATPTGGEVGSFPQDIDALMAVLKKYGGTP